jgi:peptide/nickel transport system substrate-binding protein
MLRRPSLFVLAMLAFAALTPLASCSPGAVPSPVKETVVVKETVAIRETVSVVVTPTPPTPIKTSGPVVIGTSKMTGKHFNPIWMTSTPQYLAFPLILPALTWFDDKAQPILDLATKVDVNSNATSFTFTLPKNAVWSDGTPLTSKDVAFTYKLALDPAIGSALWGTNLASIKGALDFQRGVAKDIDGMKIVDDQTIRFDLRESNAAFLFNTYLGILPSQVFGKIDPKDVEKQDFIDLPMVTSGPYQLVAYDASDAIRLKKKPNYWGKSVSIDEITIKLFDSNAAALAQLESGDVQIASIPTEEAARFRKAAHVDVLSTKGTGAYALQIDARTKDQIATLNKPKDQAGRGYSIQRTPKPFLQDKRFRQALYYALDRKAIIQAVFGGEAAPIYSAMAGPDWAVNPNLNKYDQNLDKAKSLLKEANIALDAQGNALSDNKPMVLVYLAGTSEEARKLGEAVQQQLSKIGIRVDIKLVPNESFLQAAIDGEGDLIRNTMARLGADPSVSSLYYTCKAGWAELVLGYCNAKFDDAISKGILASKNEDRQKSYWDASAILNDELPSLFLFAPNTLTTVNKGLGGIKPMADFANLTWNVQDWAFQK